MLWTAYWNPLHIMHFACLSRRDLVRLQVPDQGSALFQPGCVAARRALGSWFTLLMISFQDLSTCRNILASAGSCLWISGALKMLSRYSQFLWHVSHSSCLCSEEGGEGVFTAHCQSQPGLTNEKRLVTVSRHVIRPIHDSDSFSILDSQFKFPMIFLGKKKIVYFPFFFNINIPFVK